jgi:hypothetical protein
MTSFKSVSRSVLVAVLVAGATQEASAYSWGGARRLGDDTVYGVATWAETFPGARSAYVLDQVSWYASNAQTYCQKTTIAHPIADMRDWLLGLAKASKNAMLPQINSTPFYVFARQNIKAAFPVKLDKTCVNNYITKP